MWSSFFFPCFSYFCLFTKASDLVKLVDLVEGEVIKRKVLKVVSLLTLADVRGGSFSQGRVCGFFRDPPLLERKNPGILEAREAVSSGLSLPLSSH